MQTTYPEAQFNFIDVTALPDSTVTTGQSQDFADADLFQANVRQAPYGTMELNSFILDGSRAIFPAGQPEDVAYWGTELSNEECLYENNPTIEVNFTRAHGSIGLTLYFAEDIPAEVNVTWYTLTGTKLDEMTVYPVERKVFCAWHVENYGRIVIEIVKSSLPDRYAKMDYIEYGQMWTLGRDNIKSASIYEEMDPISATLAINTAQIEIIDSESEFDLTNNDGLWRSLQKEQEVALVEYINGNPVDCGTFYLDDWSSQENLVSFSLIDVIGVMDKTMFYGGTIYEDVQAGVIIDAIMSSAGVLKYSVDEEIYNTRVSGWLAIQSHRAALQQVVFACGAVADCSRGDWVRICRPDRYVSHTVGIDRKFTGTKVTLDEYISSVAISYNQYSLESEPKQISKSVLPVGQTRIEFGEPYLAGSITASAGSIIEVSTNYVVIQMESETECILSGQKYLAVENTYTAHVQTIEAGEVAKTKTYKGCTMMDAVKARNVAKGILDYLQLRQLVEMRYINDGEAVGNWCDIELVGGGHVTTGIFNQTIDLASGNIGTVNSRGYNRTVSTYYFAADEPYELYVGEEGII